MGWARPLSRDARSEAELVTYLEYLVGQLQLVGM